LSKKQHLTGLSYEADARGGCGGPLRGVTDRGIEPQNGGCRIAGIRGSCVGGERWPSQLVATATADRVSTTIWSGSAAAGLYLGTGLILAFLVHTHYPGALGLREWIRVVLSWPLIFFMRSKSEARRSNAKIRSRTTTPL
jgi:hypothetical protein